METETRRPGELRGTKVLIAMVDRELRMIEQKKEDNAPFAKVQQPAEYRIT